ncbi:hypothetical protein AMS68_005006 [Peltaster fructicola]|uniref:Zn(2)-C6 fungal-type domain-containing protein n=1 Tax=Peltaster fructicola TaxID=286661 RepID=A0A6H0XXZ1_9PEZI|nr:hypothetical protein AMS68_005006 [Peltaster fructicola]
MTDDLTPHSDLAITHITPEADDDHDGDSPDGATQHHGTSAGQSSTSERVLIDAKNRTPNPRSCVTCRRRKVRCDKMHPCANCTRAHIECIFPAPGRAPRKTRKIEGGRDKELLDRLRRLEGVVKGLGVDVPGSIEIPAAKDPTTESQEQEQGAQPVVMDSSKWIEEMSAGRFENKFGRLVINEGKSRYVNNSFWANLSNEVEDLKGILNQSSEEEDLPSPGIAPSTTKHHNEFVFGYSSQSVDMLSLHPPPAAIPMYWKTYKENVDPLVKVLHIPTTEPTVLSAASHLAHLSKGFETLMFAIYYGATTTLESVDCLGRFGESKQVLLARYRFGLEQALARANFLITEELVVLQSFLIFLICLRRNSDARIIWTLTGLVVRMGQTLGVHRDGTHFGLTPFETEMRRRAWWQICILDTRASEDHGCDPTIIEQAFDTRLPLNINDTDIMPSSAAFPPERQGCTDISFCLIRCEVSSTFRRINYIPPGPSKNCNTIFMGATLADKEKWITECHQRLEEKYLKDCDMTVPLYWVTATVARLMMSKMWLMAYHPFQRHDGGVGLSAETKEKLFITSLENIEYSLLLETETRTRKWGWLFKTYMQWHALAFLLSELCHRTKGDLVERAWVAVEKTRTGRWGDVVNGDIRGGHLWRPLRKLYRKARDARQHGLQEEQLEKPITPASMPTRTYSPNANPMFGHPKRPTMTRAPLSQAQLQRFTQGPVFGEQPLDSHELLKSPNGSHASKDNEMIPLTDADLEQLISQNGVQSYPLSTADGFTMSPVADTSKSTMPLGDNLLQYSQMDFNNLNAIPDGTIQDNFRMDSMDSSFDPLMDTTDDVNWHSWDQLVRQFGMDVDQVPTQAPNWSIPNWETAQGQPNTKTGNAWF